MIKLKPEAKLQVKPKLIITQEIKTKIEILEKPITSLEEYLQGINNEFLEIVDEGDSGGEERISFEDVMFWEYRGGNNLGRFDALNLAQSRPMDFREKIFEEYISEFEGLERIVFEKIVFGLDEKGYLQKTFDDIRNEIFEEEGEVVDIDFFERIRRYVIEHTEGCGVRGEDEYKEFLKEKIGREDSSFEEYFMKYPYPSYGLRDVDIQYERFMRIDAEVFYDGMIKVKVFSPQVRLRKYDKGKDKFFLQEIKEANAIKEGIEDRAKKLGEIIYAIFKLQKNFFSTGEILPMTEKDISQITGYDESTVSRVVKDKVIKVSPLVKNREFWMLKEFFKRGYKSRGKGSEVYDKEKIRSFIMEVIQNEDKTKPLSDEEIRKEIKTRFGVDIPRRTIGKYRDGMGIPSSGERKTR